jgi:uncharacterized protein (TIGR02678 family)
VTAGLTTRADEQDTFVGLLTAPLVSARVDAARFRAVIRHRAQLSEWCARLGYRLVITGAVARLHRDPSGPQRTAAPPAWDPPPRRVLVLTALVAAACESTDVATTVQILSDEVRALSASPRARVTAYNPDRRSERQAFVRGIDQLAALGILLRRTSDEALLRQWEEEGTGIGGGFEIDHDALLQFTDPHTVSLALQPPAADRPDDDGGNTPARMATRAHRLLRTLVEDTALLYADLHPLDAEYARGQRSWLADRAADMTGGTVEMRAEGMLLRLPQDRPASAMATVGFPAATAAPWFALKMLDAATSGRQPDESGRIMLGRVEVEAAATRVYQDNYGALTKAMKESPARMLSMAQEVLLGAGLIRQTDAGWAVLPVAARYRDPKAVWEPALANFGDDAGTGEP